MALKRQCRDARFERPQQAKQKNSTPYPPTTPPTHKQATSGHNPPTPTKSHNTTTKTPKKQKVPPFKAELFSILKHHITN